MSVFFVTMYIVNVRYISQKYVQTILIKHTIRTFSALPSTSEKSFNDVTGHAKKKSTKPQYYWFA